MDRDEGERVGRRIITHQKEKKKAWLQEEKWRKGYMDAVIVDGNNVVMTFFFGIEKGLSPKRIT
jgi:hypothetical protein